MAEDVQAGRLHLDAYADTTGVTKGLQARLNAEMKRRNIRAKIRAEIDTKGFVGEARRAAAEATKAASNVRIKIKAEIDARSLATDIRATVREASKANTSTVKIKAAVDRKALSKDIKDATAKVDVDVDADTDDARAKIGGLRDEEQEPITLPVQIKADPLQAASSALSQLSQIPMLVGGFYNLGTAIVQVGGGLFAMAAAASTAAGALAAIPSLLGVAGQGLGALIGGFKGVGEAVKQLQTAEQTGAQTASASSAARQAAYDNVRQSAEALRDAEWALARSAESVRDAREALSDAHYNAAEASEESAERIKDAEAAVRQSYLNSLAAQVALTRARESARDRIADLNRELRLSAADEAEAAEAVNLARERLQDVTMDASSSEQDRRGAVVDLMAAEAALERQTQQQIDLAAETAQANKDGVEGSEEVKDAQQQVKDARQEEIEAVQALADAREQADRQAILTARSLRDAQENVRDALHAQQEAAEAVAEAQRGIGVAAAAAADPMLGMSAATVALNDAMDNLGPAGQAFARFVAGTLLPRMKEMRLAIQEAILPGIQQGITNAMPFFDTLQAGLVESGRIVGNFATNLGTLFGSDSFNFDIAGIMASNNRSLRDFLAVGRNMIEILTDIAFVAGPTLVEPFMKWLRALSRSTRLSAETNRKNGDMEESFIKIRDRVRQLKDIIVNLGDSLWDLGKAASPTGDRLLDAFEKTTQGWSDFTSSEEGEDKMRRYFESTEQVTIALGDFLAQLAELIIKLSEGNSGPLTVFIDTLTRIVEGFTWLLDLHPGVGQFIGTVMTLGLVGGVVGKVSSGLLGLGANIRKLVKVVPGLSKRLLYLRSVAGMVTNTLKSALGAALKGLGRGMLRAVKATGRLAMSLAKGLAKAAASAAKAMGRLVATMARAAATALVATARFLAQKAALVVMRIATIAQTIATKIATAAQKLNNLMMLASPMGLVIAAVLAVVGIFVLLYKKVDWFRKGVHKALGAVGAIFQWLKDRAHDLLDFLFLHSVFPDIVAGFRWFVAAAKRVLAGIASAFKVVADAAVWLWNNGIKPAMNGIKIAIAAVWPVVKTIFGMFVAGIRRLGRIFRWLWANVVRPAFAGIKRVIGFVWAGVKVYFAAWRAAIRFLANAVRWLWRNIVVPAFRGVRSAISVAWGIIKPILRFFWNGLQTLGGWVKWLWNKVVTPAWAGIKTSINNVWGFLRDKVFNPLVKLVKTTIPNAFDNGVAGIKKIWDTLESIAKKPVKFVVDTVYNNGLRNMIGALPGVDKPDRINLGWAKGTSSVLPGYSPGRDNHQFVSTDGRTGLGLSGGEGIARPEVVRQVGTRAWDAMNYAARKGGDAIGALLGRPQHGRHTGGPGFAHGGVIGALSKRLSFFLGGVMPLQAGAVTGEHTLPYYNTGATWAGDLNGPLDLANPPARVMAFKSGTVARIGYGTTSYGNHAFVNHPGGGTSLYAHMSSIVARVGQQIAAGGMLGRVGQSGNAQGAHLHFELRGAPAVGGAGAVGATSSLTPEEIKQAAAGEDKADGWKSAISKILGLIKDGAGWLDHVKNKTGPWGKMIGKTVSSIGSGVRDWINGKIPDEIPLPGKIPDIPLPKNPIPKLFDAGGQWASGTLGLNLSGSTETVFTNREIVSVSASLAEMSRSLRASIVESSAAGGLPPLVGELSITGRPDEIPGLLSDANMELRRIRRGGVHATRNAS